MSEARIGPSTLPLRLLLWLFALLTVSPFALLVLTSLKSQKDLLAGAFVLPERPHFENFATAWVDGHFSAYFVNSVVVVIPVVGISIILGIFSGFGFAFLTLPFKRTLFVMLTIGMMVPTEAFIIPLFYEFHWLGLLNSYWALILVNNDSARTLPIGMLFFQGKYLIDIPVLTAGAVFIIAPIIVVYMIFQRNFIAGLTAGAVK